MKKTQILSTLLAMSLAAFLPQCSSGDGGSGDGGSGDGGSGSGSGSGDGGNGGDGNGGGGGDPPPEGVVLMYRVPGFGFSPDRQC